MLFYNGKSLAYATSHKLSLSGNAIEVSSKDSAEWTDKIIGKLSWNITSENLFTETDYTSMVELWMARQPIDVIFSVKDPAATTIPEGGWIPKAASGFKGKVVITQIEANASDNENATYSITLEGTGSLSKVTV